MKMKNIIKNKIRKCLFGIMTKECLLDFLEITDTESMQEDIEDTQYNLEQLQKELRYDYVEKVDFDNLFDNYSIDAKDLKDKIDELEDTIEDLQNELTQYRIDQANLRALVIPQPVDYSKDERCN